MNKILILQTTFNLSTLDTSNHDYLFCHILQIIIFGIEVGTDIRPSDLNPVSFDSDLNPNVNAKPDIIKPDDSFHPN